MVELYYGILSSNKREQITYTENNMVESHRHSEEKMLNTEEYILDASIYINF